MELDDVFRLLGKPGRYHVLLYLWLCFCFSLSAFILMGMVFIGSMPKRFYCTPPPGFQANQTIPRVDGPNAGACHMYEVIDEIVTENITGCKYGWNYVSDIKETTLVMDFNLVCDNAILVKVAQSVLMAGILVGSITSGHVSDYLGRKQVLHISMLGETVSGLATAFVSNYYAFLVAYFFFGVFQQGVLNSAFVIISEMFEPKMRTYATSGTSVAWGLGVTVVAPVAYLLPNWRHYQLFVSLIHLIGVPMWWIDPESTRWLISRGRIKEAEDDLRKMARFNGVNAPERFLDENVVLLGPEIPDSQIARYYFTDVIKSPILLRSFLILGFCWFTNSIVYYGLSINSALLDGNKYLNVFVSCLVEFPSGLIMVLCLKWIGRRPAISSAFFFGGVCCVLIAFLPDQTESGKTLNAVIVALSSVGKFWASFSFSMGYVMSPEIMPTVIRQVTLGGFSFCARAGGILAPFIIYLGDFNEYIPLSVLGVFAFVALLACLALPETRNQALPETIKEGEDMSRRINIFSKGRHSYKTDKNNSGSEENTSQIIS